MNAAGAGSLHVLVMAKAPVAGRVKTRLCPPLSWNEAAEIAEAALADTLESALACHGDRVVVALDGAPGPWLPAGVELVAQRGEGLASRLAHAWADTRAGGDGWGIQIGMDTPQVTPDLLDRVLETLVAAPVIPGGALRAVLGAALDGGWWVIGLPGTDPHQVFNGVPMSAPDTHTAQRRRLRALGLEVAAAPVLRDIDTVDDLREVVGEIAPGRTGQIGRRILRGLDVAIEDGAA